VGVLDDVENSCIVLHFRTYLESRDREMEMDERPLNLWYRAATSPLPGVCTYVSLASDLCKSRSLGRSQRIPSKPRYPHAFLPCDLAPLSLSESKESPCPLCSPVAY
jgi:hypothetical protein